MDTPYQDLIALDEADYESAILLAEGLDFETYLRQFMGQHTEWVSGKVYQMSPISRQHNNISHFLLKLLDYYLEQTSEGECKTDPFAMRLSPNYAPQPDLLVVKNAERLQETYLDGAADLVIEIVSKESIRRDRGMKFELYETFGVPEYWIIDPLRNETLFYVLDEDGIYQPQTLDGDFYQAKVLPRLRLNKTVLFQDILPTTLATIQLVNDMLKGEAK